MKTKRKYLCIKVTNGALHVWADTKGWGDLKTQTLQDLDTESFLGDVSAETNLGIKIPVQELI